MRAVREWEERTGESLLNSKFLEFIKKYETQVADIGEPVRRHTVIPLDGPIPETPEPKIPLPEKEPKPLPLRQIEPQFSSWTATPSPKTEDDGEKK